MHKFKIGDRVVFIGDNNYIVYRKPATVFGYGYSDTVKVRHDGYDYGDGENYHCNYTQDFYEFEEVYNSPLYKALS